MINYVVCIFHLCELWATANFIVEKFVYGPELWEREEIIYAGNLFFSHWMLTLWSHTENNLSSSSSVMALKFITYKMYWIKLFLKKLEYFSRLSVVKLINFMSIILLSWKGDDWEAMATFWKSSLNFDLWN